MGRDVQEVFVFDVVVPRREEGVHAVRRNGDRDVAEVLRVHVVGEGARDFAEDAYGGCVADVIDLEHDRCVRWVEFILRRGRYRR